MTKQLGAIDNRPLVERNEQCRHCGAKAVYICNECLAYLCYECLGRECRSIWKYEKRMGHNGI